MASEDEADMVNSPPHYNNHPSGIECIEVARLCSNDMGAAIQYIWRHEDKGESERDLRKARWYLNDLLTTGQATYLPHKAKVKLEAVIAAETQDLRRRLFRCLYHGSPAAAVAAITETVGGD